MASIKTEPGSNKRSREEEQMGPSRRSSGAEETQSDRKRPRIILENVPQVSSTTHAAGTATEYTEVSFAAPAESVVTDTPDKEPDAKLSNSEWERILHEKHYIRKVVFLAEDGDLTLVISGGHSGNVAVWKRNAKIAMIVNSGKLDEALPKWRDRIIKLQPALESGHLPIAHLIAGTPRVFRYFAAAAHEATRFDGDSRIRSEFEIKQKLGLEQVRDVAILSHQYKALNLIRYNVPGWITEFVPLAWDPEKHVSGYTNQLEYLWISYEFGLESLFHRVCFNLAYVKISFPWNPDAMPPKVFDCILKCRQAYTNWILTHIREYREAVTPTPPAKEWKGPGTSEVCCDTDRDTEEACTGFQLRAFQSWIKKENLDRKEAQSFPSLPARSPLHYFKTMPASAGSLSASHEHNKEGCGLAVLVAKLGRDGNTRLLRWAMEKGDEARPVLDEHINYIAEQKEKMCWAMYT